MTPQDSPGESAASSALTERVDALPGVPGVYLFRDADARVLYVGKAQNLRTRVRSYFVAGGDGRIQVPFLVERVRDVEIVATANVKEALLLENQLIKKHKPRFNVRLRDDKNYLGLRIDPSEEYPRFTETRRFLRDGATYFGPYTSSRSLRKTLSSLQRIFPLRTCTDGAFKSYRNQGRPCLEHAVGRCVAPCCRLVPDEEYAELVHGAVRFLKGQSGDVLQELTQRMELAAGSEEFEEAGRLRDRIHSIERTTERQSMISPRFTDRDVFGIAREGRRLEIEVLHIRQGTLLGGKSYAFSDVRIESAEALTSFVGQFYAGDRDLPRELLLPLKIEGVPALDALWRERVKRGVKTRVPQRGEGRALVETATRNAALALAERSRREHSDRESLEALRDLLSLDRVPARIECYDTSHLQGTLHVASRVAFEDGRPDKNGYRRYRMREAAPGDDYAAMRETLERRVERLDEDEAPDLIVLDGGKGQLNAVRALFRDLGVTGIQLASIAKERDEEAASPRVLRHGGSKRERVFLPGVKDPLLPAVDHPGLRMLQRVRDESHRFAIRYHRDLRSKLSTRSILDELPGIGPAKRSSLLRTLGSLERIRSATVEDLARVPKLTQADAERICSFFKAADSGADEGSSGSPQSP